MQAIQINQEQKDKLLEMCKALFPEYTNIKFTYPNMLTFWVEKGHNIYIHWFEFCITELYLRIYQEQNDTAGISDAHKTKVIKELGSIIYYEYKTHPIDYLYEHFKELKNEKV